jgi:hypothetical protein
MLGSLLYLITLVVSNFVTTASFQNQTVSQTQNTSNEGSASAPVGGKASTPTVSREFSMDKNLTTVIIKEDVLSKQEERTLQSFDPKTVVFKTDQQGLQNEIIPYNKTCLFEFLVAPEGLGSSYNVSLFYHIGMLNNWREIVLDQLDTLERCGLGYIASDLAISFHNPSTDVSDMESAQQIMELLNQYQFLTHMQTMPTIISASRAYPWERLMMEHMSTICRQRKSNHIVFYFHNKGSSKYGTGDYMNVFPWRKYMEWFLLERPTLCIKAVLHYGAKTCGVEIKVSPSMHYSGNFWSSACSHVADLPVGEAWPTGSPFFNYVSAEMWIGNYQHRPFGEESKYLNLFYTHHRLYSYTMTPDKYTWILENPNLNIGNRESYAPNPYEGYESGNQTELWMDYTQGLRGFQQ